ncbi:MAG: damage-inducible protein DinB [Roseicyclus sp.]|nr:damage-inducible protein DinB [Roseicyclus sp.]
MISPGYAQTMARYNAWQNQWVFQAADGLSEQQRQEDRAGFWGGIQSTLGHLLWGDTLWISRFDGGPGPDVALAGSRMAYDWSTLMAQRPLLDARIAAWAWSTEQSDLEGDLSWYSGAAERQMTMPMTICVVQLFNHQTHHRGQVHAMLTACGVKTDDTDLPFMPDDVPEWR